jgi:YHS domain-containing protein
MKTVIRNICIIIFGSAVLYACNNEKPKNISKPKVLVERTEKESPKKHTKGDQVPNETVCMVNNAYMGKRQIEVPHNGKTYYGCCEMCVERIPKDQSVREAVDPYTGKKVDKATAYIVIISDEGEVAYFENKENYIQFLAQQS